MAHININLEDVDDGSEPFPEGQHLVRVLSAQHKHKDGSEYPYIEVRMNALDVEDKFQKRNLRLTLSFHPNALWNLKRFVAKAGIPWDGSGLDTDDFANRELFVNVKNRADDDDPTMIRTDIGPPYSKA
jgi:hypothetical protein